MKRNSIKVTIVENNQYSIVTHEFNEIKKFEFNESDSILSTNSDYPHCGKIILKDGTSFYIREGYSDIDTIIKENCSLLNRIIYKLFKRNITTGM